MGIVSPRNILVGKPLVAGFDIFKCETEGIVLWQGTVETLELARARVQILTGVTPGAFIIFNQSTGQKLSIGNVSLPAKKFAA